MSKLLLGICDDEKRILHQMKQIVERILKEMDIEYEIYLCLTGEELIELVKILHLVFLDINMPNLDGIEVGRRIQMKNPHCKVVMVTSNRERINEAFQIKAFRFITKPLEQKKITEAISDYLNQNIGLDEIDMYLDRIQFSIPQRVIKYIRAYNGYITFKVKDKIYRKDTSLYTISKILDKRFFVKVNNSYYVNMFWIFNYKNGMVSGDDFEIKVSRRKRKEFEKSLINFDLHYS